MLNSTDRARRDWRVSILHKFTLYLKKKNTKLSRYPHLPLAKDKTIEGTPEKPIGQLDIISDTNGNLTWNANLPTYFYIPADESSNACDPDIDSCNDQPVTFNETNYQIIPDSQYPAGYIATRDAWVSTAQTSNLPAFSPPVPASADGGDSTLECAQSDIFASSQPSVNQSFIQSSILQACKTFDGITMNGDAQETLILPFNVGSQSGAKSDNIVWLGAAWNTGDTSCQTPMAVAADDCNTMLATVLNGCDTDTIDFKYGGWKVDNCIVWHIGIQGSPRVRPAAGQSTADSGQPFSCTPKYVFICLPLTYLRVIAMTARSLNLYASSFNDC